MALTLTLDFDPILVDGTDLSLPDPEKLVIDIGPQGTHHNELVTGTDGVFQLNAVTAVGYYRIRNRALATPLGWGIDPAYAPTVTPGGTPGTTSWSYKIVAYLPDGTNSIASAAGIDATGAAVLNSTDFEHIDWNGLLTVPGVDHFDVYRTAAGGTPSTTGKIGTVMANDPIGWSFDDTGLAATAGAPPSSVPTKVLLYGSATGSYQHQLYPGEIAAGRWNWASFPAIHRKAVDMNIPVDIHLLDAS